ncbi:DUF6735 family protein [Natronolimnobius baerhuensis]|uniref:Uncharacterized protein n=1 Tax=Natronolimnobius baerhuensis TaxID=253108 RepID=A0A202EAB8_9EURY|nr:DUF6735 family protein [Natronolimnobius baerhuensis]OVE85192.1 hypothetical protein B2G88_08620 [Natronolimnobius baerhuensis]
MGHRALVAYERPDHLYDLRYSHWGGQDDSLRDEITADAPLADGAVDGSLLADSITRDRILAEHLDPCVHELLYVVSPEADYTVTASVVCWLEWGDGRDAGRGALISLEPDDDVHRVRTWFRATKTVLGDSIEMGALSRRAARTYLEARVCEDYDGTIYTHGRSLDEPDAYEPRRDRLLADDAWDADDGLGGVGPH